MRGIFWLPDAWESYLVIQTQKTLLKRVNTLIKDIQRNGYKCSYGKPEMLSNVLTGVASVRIDHKNRLLFRVEAEQISIIECGGHYHDH